MSGYSFDEETDLELEALAALAKPGERVQITGPDGNVSLFHVTGSPYRDPYGSLLILPCEEYRVPICPACKVAPHRDDMGEQSKDCEFCGGDSNRESDDYQECMECSASLCCTECAEGHYHETHGSEE